MNALPPPLRRLVERELQPGERLRWLEQPMPRFWVAGSILRVLFAIPWTAFALFWTWSALGSKWPDPRDGFRPEYVFALFGLPFILVGVGMLLTPLWDWRAARGTVYVVTDQRAIALQNNGFTLTVQSYEPGQLQDVYRVERRDGTGDVIIAMRQWRDIDNNRKSEPAGFLNVKKPREVEQLLKQLARSATG